MIWFRTLRSVSQSSLDRMPARNSILNFRCFLFIAIGRVEMACNSSGLGFANRGVQLFDVVPHEPLRMAVVWITGTRRAQHGCQEQTHHYTIAVLSNDCSQDAGCVHQLNIACCSCFPSKNYVLTPRYGISLAAKKGTPKRLIHSSTTAN